MHRNIEIKKLFSGNDPEFVFRLIVEAYRDKVARFISLFVHNEQECEELSSDVFITLWKNRETWDQIEHPDSYLFIIAKNTALNHLRKEKAIKPVDWNTLQIESFYHTKTSPESIFITNEMAEMLDAAIETLPPKTKLAFHLVRENRMKYKEAAEVLGVSVKTIEKQITFAVSKLKEHIENFR